MRFRWPEDTQFRRLVLDVEEEACSVCGRPLHICDHRIRPIYTLQQPLELCCRLARCADPTCPTRPHTQSPAAELTLALPGWLIGWDVFCFLGHRRFVRHWSIPQLRDELLDSYGIRLSLDALSLYAHRYQTLLAARQQDFAQWQQAYQDIDALVLSIDGLQPEKGHETLYAVRELKARRVWFAEALLSSNQDEVNRLLRRAQGLAQQLGKPVRLWLSDKQDAFVKGIACHFAGVPHRYCVNHFLRDLAKPTLEQDSHAKVQMRKKVRGLRDIERAVLEQRRAPAAATAALPEPAGSTAPPAQGDDGDAPPDGEPAAAEPARASPPADEGNPPATPAGPVVPPQGPTAGPAEGEGAGPATPTPAEPSPVGASADRPTAQGTGTADEAASAVVLDYCAAVRGLVNDDQGGPLDPPGLRMADALREVRASLARNLELHRPGPAHGHLERLAGCIDRGLQTVEAEQAPVREQVQELRRVAATLDEKTGTRRQRHQRYQRLQQEYEQKGGTFFGPAAKMMLTWLAGLFVPVPVNKGEELPNDNLDLERWFRRPKGHERRIHGHRHAGVRIVQEGPTLLLTLNAHETHPEPFTAAELLPYRHAKDPPDQQEALHRRKIMRKARSRKKRQSLLQELEKRYRG
jgi:hypothetical protein